MIVADGASLPINRSFSREDNLNITKIWDNVTAARNQAYWYSAPNRLQNADGPWGAKTFQHDGVGNRVQEASTVSGVTTTDVYGYPATSNRLVQVTRGAATVRAMTYDGGGNMLTDNRAGSTTTYTYNKRNRLETATSGALVWGYTYNGREQLVRRNLNVGGTNLTHFVHDIFGNVIAETNGTAAGTNREYIWLPETEIAPTYQSRAQVDRPLGVVNGVGTAGVALWYVSVDHLNRPIRMTNAAKASVWDATWLPWGGVHSITGTGVLNARLPGQWFQLEAGLHYNWHRHYDPGTGRYTQPDPLGFVDGPSVYAYAGGSPLQFVDIDGRFYGIVLQILGRTVILPFTEYSAAAVLSAMAGAAALSGDSINMPPINRPDPPGGGKCSCTCRAGDASNVSTYRFAKSTQNSCAAAAIDSCGRAVSYCPRGADIHHVQASCSDGSNRGGDGKIAR